MKIINSLGQFVIPPLALQVTDYFFNSSLSHCHASSTMLQTVSLTLIWFSHTLNQHPPPPKHNHITPAPPIMTL